MLKMVAGKIVSSLADLFNYSLRTQSFPAAWKRANISPVHKNGARDLGL